MSDPQDKGTLTVSQRDPVPIRIGFPANSSVVGHLHAVMSHTRVFAGSGRGSLHRERCQQGYNDGNDHPLETHFGLPDIGPWNGKGMDANARKNPI
jgi:hypothetical protein